MNYTELKQAIQDYTENAETTFVNNLYSFIKQAERRIYNEVQLPVLRKNSTGLTASGNTYLQLPDDFLASYSLAVINSGAYSYLINKDVNWIREAYNSTSTTGLPKYYSLFDDDTILMFDESASALRKVTKANFSPSLTYTAGAATGDGSTTAFTINSGRAVANVLAIVNGAILIPTTDYTISGTTLTFATAPAGGAEIQIRYLPI